MRSGAGREQIVARAGGRRRLTRIALLAAGAAVAASTLSACSIGASAAGSDPGKIVAVGAENEYADVIGQVGGQYVQVSAIMSNPNTDPHSFEASPAVAREINAAQLIVQNGVSYDTFMSTIENAASTGDTKVIDVQTLLGLPDSTPNPHLWYDPATMPKVADAIATDLAAIQPAHAAYFKARAKSFVASLDSWYSAIAAFKKAYAGVPVATTEPVADYMLQAVGADNLTPWTFQADIMNGVDPSPQNVAAQKALFTDHKVKVFLYNQQVTDPLTESLITLADQNHIPVVGVYETMPTPGYDYQTWMLTEVQDLRKAVADKVSTEHL
ncbi:MAG TPA: zinc ABC transporter substrate-binding protein [Trebonia sp.]|jgi:zinc/manganese transport system substrate-binding protein|nr:zinc ABC transporter substrate-binding protein [Trebonia sp.]